MACACSMAFRFISIKIDRGVPVGRGDTGVAKPLADRENVDTRSQQMYCGAMAHAVRVQTLGREYRCQRSSSCRVLLEDVADTEAGDAGTTAITEQRIVGKRPAPTFFQERTEDFGGLRPQWA
jgi:hypothetical protein